MRISMKRNCFCCEKQINVEGSINGSAKDGTVWKTNGNYNSAVFDPMGDDWLEIIICDECLIKKADLALFYTIEHSKKYKDVKKFNNKLKEYELAKKELSKNKFKDKLIKKMKEKKNEFKKHK